MTYEDTDWSYGRVAFETYKVHVGGIAYTGHPIPGWHDLTDRQREAWDLGAMAVVHEFEIDSE